MAAARSRRPVVRIPVDDVEQLGFDAHLPQIDAGTVRQIGPSGLRARSSETLGANRLWIDMPVRTTLAAGRQAAMNATGQHQHAGKIAGCVRVLILASSGPPGRLSAKHSASDLPWQASTSVDPDRGVDAATAQDPAEAGCDIEIGLAPGVDHHRKLASGLPVENVEQPLVGIPLHGAFGGNPFRAARPAGAGRARARHKRSWRRAANRCRRPAAAPVFAPAQNRPWQRSPARRR